MKEYIDFSNGPLPDVEYRECAAFWEGTRKGEIRFPRCQDCKKYHFYPYWLCPFCHSPNIKWQALTSQPRLFTWTCVRRNLSPVFSIRGPYIVALVEFDEAPGFYLTTNLVECQPEDLQIGMPLEVIFQKVDDKITMPIFKPIKDK
jgi:uncharacterized OB-fold protein